MGFREDYDEWLIRHDEEEAEKNKDDEEVVTRDSLKKTHRNITL